uniref:F-box domain-containing protein n=1 Tax=Angiostrongylus cantonensis TaxID=6313 RepID=A0A0K0CTG1_ANGCA
MVGIFIVDRRRAILEKILVGSEPPKMTATRSERSHIAVSGPSVLVKSSHNSETSDILSIPPETTTLFMEDQFVDQTQSSWAFTFDFTTWAEKHHVVEVCLQNFCSFLDREHIRMEFFGTNGNPDGSLHGNSLNTTLASDFHCVVNLLTPPWSGGVSGKSPPVDAVCPGAVKSEQRGYAYYQLPSARALMNHTPPLTTMDDETITELTNLSAGRLERLAQALKAINPLHIVFRDHSLYSCRPTLLLIWFLKLLKPSLRRVTFDGIQAHHLIPLHKILDISGIDELNVKQPQFSPAICVSHRLLLNWLALPIQHRRKLRMRLLGCRTMTARGLAVFVQAWKATVEPCLFDQISIDLRSVPVYDFLAEMETPTKDLDEIPLQEINIGDKIPGCPQFFFLGTNNHLGGKSLRRVMMDIILLQPEDWRPPTPPAAAYGHGPMAAVSRWNDCKLSVKHRKGNSTINMMVTEGFLVLKCSSNPARSNQSTTGISRRNGLQRPSSVQCFDSKTKSASLPRQDSQVPLKRIESDPIHRCPSVFDKMFGFLLRSNA